MSKLDIDYSCTVIYKITCKDTNIPDKYVGHTTDFVKRKYAHKRSSHNETSANYHLKLYKFIRDNGGWDNWKMEMIQFYDCKNHYEARVREQEHYIELKATLNSIEPLKHLRPVMSHDKPEPHKPTPTTTVPDVVENSIDDIVHIREMDTDTHFCDVCNLNYSDKYKYKRHLATQKHHFRQNGNDTPALRIACLCGKEYKHRQGLYAHKKNCRGGQVTLTDSVPDLTRLVIELVKTNQELVKGHQELRAQSLETQQQLVALCRTTSSRHATTL